MATINVVNVTTSTDGFVTRTVTNDAEVEYDTYRYPVEQDYLKITNNNLDDIMFNVNGFEKVILHGLQTWENNVNFTEFTIISLKGSVSFTAVTKEYDTTPVTVDMLWDLLAIRDKTESGDMILVSADATSSAGTINAAIAGETGKSDRTVDIKITNTAGVTHTWLYGTFPVTVAKESLAGVVSIAQTVVPLNAGVGTVVITHTGTWAEADTITLTIIGGTKYGYAIANDTSVDTLGA